MKNVDFSNRQRLKVSQWNHLYIFKWRRRTLSHNNLWLLLVLIYRSWAIVTRPSWTQEDSHCVLFLQWTNLHEKRQRISVLVFLPVHCRHTWKGTAQTSQDLKHIHNLERHQHLNQLSRMKIIELNQLIELTSDICRTTAFVREIQRRIIDDKSGKEPTKQISLEETSSVK